MTVSATWTSPAAAGALDLSAGTVVTETHWDAMVSNFLYLGGSAGTVVPIASYSQALTQNTTSSTLVAITGVVTPALVTVGVNQIIWVSGTFANSTLNAVNGLGISVDGGAFVTVGRWTQSVATHAAQISFVMPKQLSAASHTIALGWATGAGTLSSDPNSLTTLIMADLRH